MELHPADIVLVQGTAWISKHIMQATNGQVSHAAMVVGTNPNICLEALTRVRTNPIEITVAGASAVWIMHNKVISQQQRDAIVKAALHYSANSYGYLDIGLQGVDAMFKTTWWTDKIGGTFLNHWPICSYIPAESYMQVLGSAFGKKPVDSITPQDIFEFGSQNPNLYEIAKYV